VTECLVDNPLDCECQEPGSESDDDEPFVDYFDGKYDIVAEGEGEDGECEFVTFYSEPYYEGY